MENEVIKKDPEPTRQKGFGFSTGTLVGLGIGGAFAYGIYSLFSNFSKGEKQYEKDIEKSQDELERLPVKVWELTRPQTAYRLIADSIHQHLDDEQWFGIWSKLKWNEVYNSVAGLNPAELRQVAKEFGYRNAKSFFGRTNESANIFTWFEGLLDANQQTAMCKVWQKSGLWGVTLTPAQKNAALKAKWKPFTEIDITNKMPVFPAAVSLERMMYVNGKNTPLPNIQTVSYWQLGNAIARISDSNVIYWVKVQFTNTMYKDFVGKQVWILATSLNKTAPDQNDPFNFPISNL